MKKLIMVGLIAVTFLAGCGQRKEENSIGKKEKLEVYTSIYPINYIVTEIGGESVSVENVVPLGTDPHDFEPSMKTVGNIRNSDLFIYNGAGLESWAESISNEIEPEKVIEAAKLVDLIDIEDSHEEEDHDEEDPDDHEHGDKDPHIWLSLNNMNKIAKVVESKLSELDPENKDLYKANYEKLEEKLLNLDERYREELKGRTSSTILVSHSAFKYLAKEYDIEQIAVAGISPSAEPSPRTLSKLIDIASEKKLKYIYFETLASPKSVEMLSEEANLEPLVLNTLEGLSEENIKNKDDYITLMEENLENLKKELLK
jgi:zinc transport system substrate-binding protein